MKLYNPQISYKDMQVTAKTADTAPEYQLVNDFEEKQKTFFIFSKEKRKKRIKKIIKAGMNRNRGLT